MGKKNGIKPAQVRKGLDAVYDIQMSAEDAPSFADAVILFSGKNILLEDEFRAARLLPQDLEAIRKNQGNITITDAVQEDVIKAAEQKLRPLIEEDYYKNPDFYS